MTYSTLIGQISIKLDFCCIAEVNTSKNSQIIHKKFIEFYMKMRYIYLNLTKKLMK